jgi:hypothetical protein
MYQEPNRFSASKADGILEVTKEEESFVLSSVRAKPLPAREDNRAATQKSAPLHNTKYL